MAHPTQCLKCGGSMTEGYVMARVPHGIPALSGWVEGKPKKSIWTGLKVTGRPRMELAAWKCGRCGFVELYATGDSVAAEKAERKTLGIVLAILALGGAILAAILIGTNLD